MSDKIIPFPLGGSLTSRTHKAVGFKCLAAPASIEEPLELHLILENGVKLLVPIDHELVYDIRAVLNAINPPLPPE